MPATITRAWTHVKNFIERHALAFLTPFLVLSFLMYKAEAGYPADGYSYIGHDLLLRNALPVRRHYCRPSRVFPRRR